MKTMHFALAALAALAFTACSDDTTDPIEHSFQYDLTVTGDVAQRLRGPAFFGADTDENGDPAFGILMGADTSSHIVMLVRSGTTRPGAGSYSISQVGSSGNPWIGMLLTADGEELTGLYISDEGELTITESSATRLKGSLDFTAVGFFDGSEEPVEVRVTGTFDARAAPNLAHSVLAR